MPSEQPLRGKHLPASDAARPSGERSAIFDDLELTLASHTNHQAAVLAALAAILVQPAVLLRADFSSFFHSRSASPASLAAQTDLRDRALGSNLPCAVPLTWRITEIDPRFGLDEPEARAALEEAMALWNRAVDGELFALDPDRGFPIRFHFDDRQALAQVRRGLEADVEAAARRIEDRRREITEARERFDQIRVEYEARVARYTERVAEHTREVERWNARGGAPDSVRAPILERAERLGEERLALDRQRMELQRVREWIEAETAILNENIRELNLRSEAIRRDLPVTVSEAGRYAESIRMRGSDLDSVDREIRIFRFDDRDQLVLILAHELGHALGLGHSDRSDSVMSEVLTPGSESSAPDEVSPHDVARLRTLCPGV